MAEQVDWHVSMFDIHLRRILSVYCPGNAGVKGNDRADRLVGKATITGGLRPGESELLRSLRQYLRAQRTARTAHHRSPGGDRGRKRKRSTIFLEKTRKGHRQSVAGGERRRKRKRSTIFLEKTRKGHGQSVAGKITR